MKRRDFIKDSAVSALAVGTAPHTFGTEDFRQRKVPDLAPAGEA